MAAPIPRLVLIGALAGVLHATSATAQKAPSISPPGVAGGGDAQTCQALRSEVYNAMQRLKRQGCLRKGDSSIRRMADRLYRRCLRHPDEVRPSKLRRWRLRVQQTEVACAYAKAARDNRPK